MVPKPTGETLTWTSIRFSKYRNVRASRIKVEVWKKIRMFKQFLCEEVVSPLLECFMRIYGYFV